MASGAHATLNKIDGDGTSISEPGRAGATLAPGINTKVNMKLRALGELRERSPHIPMIIDAGIGLPCHACQAMEWGFDGVFPKLKRRQRGREKVEELPGIHPRVD